VTVSASNDSPSQPRPERRCVASRRLAERRRLVSLLACLALAVACSGSGGSAPPGAGAAGSGSGAAGSGAVTRSTEPGGSGGAAAGSGGTGPSAAASGDASLPAGEFRNPVLARSFADPFILKDGSKYVAFATGNLTYNIQVATSDDLVTWSSPHEALGGLAIWQPSSKGLTWAPEVMKTSAGYVMYYTARDVQAGKQCLSIAIATEATGPYEDDSKKPLVCQTDLGGSIDSSPFKDQDGAMWLLWKNDGNCCGEPTRIWAERLSADGTKLTGEVHDLGERNDKPWERNVVEAPTLLLHDGTYVLFYSANAYNTRDYAVGYATAKDLLGPYTDGPENPILKTTAPVGSPPGQAAGPGHQSVVQDDDGELWMVYHAWDVARVGDEISGTRSLWIDPLTFEDGKPVVHGPNASPQPVP
jgi:beta-xylosidase